mmetsp:Transcript_12905/g.14535  ORF Transcript_12905/g.14535 Transcript_12905/m.14535 type:complete len:85 (-) Transcript_12905:55-309(-)
MKPELFEDTNSVDDSDDEYDESNQIVLKQFPKEFEKTKDHSPTKAKSILEVEGSFFATSAKRMDLGSKEVVKKCPFLNTLSKPS